MIKICEKLFCSLTNYPKSYVTTTRDLVDLVNISVFLQPPPPPMSIKIRFDQCLEEWLLVTEILVNPSSQRASLVAKASNCRGHGLNLQLS